MTVAFDAVGPSSAGAGNAGTSPLTWLHTCGAGATALYVGVAVGLSPGVVSDNSITCTATFNSVSMTAMSPGQSANGSALTGNDGFVKVFKLASPTTGSALTVSITVSPTTNVTSITGGSISVTGSGTESALTQAFNAGPVTSGSINVPSTTSGNLCLCFFTYGTVGSTTMTAGTLRYQNEQNNSSGAGSNTGATLASPGGTATISWNEASDGWAAIAFESQVAAGAKPSGPPLGKQDLPNRPVFAVNRAGVSRVGM